MQKIFQMKALTLIATTLVVFAAAAPAKEPMARDAITELYPIGPVHHGPSPKKSDLFSSHSPNVSEPVHNASRLGHAVDLTSEFFPPGLVYQGFDSQNIREVDAYGFKYGVETYVIEIQLATEHLEAFVENLRGFVNDTHFDYVAFRNSSRDLNREITRIATSIHRVKVPAELSHLLRYALHLYKAMMDLSQIMVLYNDDTNPVWQLVYNVAELGVRTLALNNSHGALDLHVRDYLGKLVMYFHDLHLYAGKFRAFSFVPMATRELFHVLVREVNLALEDVRSWVPV